jgi:hypothetical protein
MIKTLMDIYKKKQELNINYSNIIQVNSTNETIK